MNAMIKANNVDEFKILQYMKKYMELEEFQLRADVLESSACQVTFIEATDKRNQKIYFYIDGKTILYADSIESINILPF